MNLNCDELQQLTALEAVGALEGLDAERLRQRLMTDAPARLELQRFMEVAAALAGTVPRQRPSASLRGKVLARIARTPQAKNDPGTADRVEERVVKVPPGFQFVPREAPWIQGPLPGVRFKLLSAAPDQGHVILEVELGPGAVYPEHEHIGPEDMYVLTGDLQTEGMMLGPGDSFHAEPGTSHDGLRSVEGCTALLIVSKAAFDSMQPA